MELGSSEESKNYLERRIELNERRDAKAKIY